MLIDELHLKSNHDLISIQSAEKVSKAADVLNRHNIGALPVFGDTGDLVGIISERDIVRGLSENGAGLQDLSVSELMTKDVITCTPDDDVNDIMAVMNDNGIRHIPVIEENHLSGVVSSRDLMAAVLEETKSHCQTLGLAYEMVR
jgi:CBS domain-containing protein